MGKSKDLATGETRFVNTAGDSMTGALTVSEVNNTSSLVSARYNNSNRKIGFNANNSNGQGFLAFNSNSVSGSANQTYDTNGVAAKIDYTGAMTFDLAASGTAGNTITYSEKMRISSDGHVTKPNQPGFWVQATTNTGDYQSGPIVFSSSNSNVTTSSLISNGGTHFNTTNGRFTAPVAGLYQFNTQVRIDSFGGSYSYASIWDSGTNVIGRDLTSINTTYYTHTISATRYLSANDYVYVTLVSGGDSSVSVSSDSWFSGFLIG